MAWNKTNTFLRDVFATPKLGPKGSLTDFFRNEYRNEYKHDSMFGSSVTDSFVADFLQKRK